MMHKTFALTIATVSFATAAFAATPIRLEAEDAVLADDHKVVVIEDAKASGGKYVDMKDGNLEFKVPRQAITRFGQITKYHRNRPAKSRT